MKKVILFSLMFILFACSEDKPKPFTGYVVAKNYEEGHMCHSEYKNYLESSIPLFTHIHHHVHHHHYVEPVFTLHIANKDELRHVNVDSLTYINSNVLDKMTFMLD